MKSISIVSLFIGLITILTLVAMSRALPMEIPLLHAPESFLAEAPLANYREGRAWSPWSGANSFQFGRYGR